MSAINTPTYKIAKLLVPIVKSLTSNEHTVKDSFVFVEEIVEQVSLFTNISIEEAIDICTNTLFQNREQEGLSKIEYKKLLSIATKESYFIFNEKLYKQVPGVAMSSPLGPRSANDFLVHFEKNCCQNCSSDFKPHYYHRYVDDIFVLFTSLKHLEFF